MSGLKQGIIVDLGDLEKCLTTPDSAFAREQLLEEPHRFMPTLEQALIEAKANDDPSFLKNPKALRPRLGLSGVFGKYHVTPRGLTADLLNKMICVDGIVMLFVQIPARSEKYRDSAKRDFLRSRSLYVVDFLRSSHKCIRPLFPYRCRL